MYRSFTKDEVPPASPAKDPDLYTKPPEELKNHVMFGTGQRVGLMTADAPRHPAAPGGNEELKRDLKNYGLKYEETQGSYGGPENSIIIHNPTRQLMQKLGKKFGQEAVIYGENGQHQMIYTNGENEGKYHPSLPLIRYTHKEPDDYWTRIPGKGHVTLHFDNDTLLPISGGKK